MNQHAAEVNLICAVRTPGKGVLENSSINHSFSCWMEHNEQTHLPPHLGSYPSAQPGFLHWALKLSCPSRRRGGHTSSTSQEQWAVFSWITVASSALPSHLARSAPPLTETGSCDKHDRHFQPINSRRTSVSHCQSHFRWLIQFSHPLLRKKKSKLHTKCLKNNEKKIVYVVVTQ